MTGRKTGKKIPRPVQFVLKGDSILLVPFMGKSTNWYRNLISSPEVKIAFGDVAFSGRAKILGEKGARDAVALFTKTYGKRMMESRYPRKDAAVEIPLPY